MRLSAFFCTFLLGLCGAAGSDYSIVVKGPFDGALFDIAEGHDRTIGSIGYSRNFGTALQSGRAHTDAFSYLASLREGGGEQARLIRLDGAGERTLDISFSLPQFNRAVSLVNTPSGGCFAGGSLQDGQLVVAELDASGGTRFLRRFGTANRDRMQQLVALRDGGVLAVGSSMTSRAHGDAIHEQGLGLDDIYLTRFSKSGEQLWSKKYGTSGDDRGIAAAEAEDGTLFIAGTTTLADASATVLLRLSENGDKLWLKHHTAVGGNLPHALIALRNGGFLLSSSIKDAGGLEHIRLTRFDDRGETTASRDVDSARSSTLLSIREQANGRIVGVGYSVDGSGSDTDALAMLFDPHLNTLWSHRYGGKSRDIFRAVTVLHDGTFAAAGETVSVGSEISDMWVVKLNDDGSVAAKSDSAKSLYDALAKTFAGDIAAGRISLGKDLVITLTGDALLFEAGVYELTAGQQTFLDGFSPKLLALLQSYKAEIAGLRVNGHTSSEWRGTDFTHRYLNNAKLSAQRAYSVLSHIFAQDKSAPYRPWLTDILTNNGYAFSQLVKRPEEDREASRRAAFAILLK